MDNRHIANDTKELWKRLLSPGDHVLPLRSRLSDASIQSIQLQILKLENLISEQNEQLTLRFLKMESMMTKNGKRDKDCTETPLKKMRL